MIQTTFSLRSVTAAFLSGLLLAACNSGDGGNPIVTQPLIPDSVHVSVPSADYAVSREYEMVCDTADNCEELLQHVVYVELDTLSPPRAVAESTCVLSGDGLLKASVGTGSNTVHFSTPLRVLSQGSRVTAGNWREDKPLTYVLHTDPGAYWNFLLSGGTLPDSLILGGRKATLTASRAHGRSLVMTQCEKYYGADSIRWYDGSESSDKKDLVCSSEELKAGFWDGNIAGSLDYFYLPGLRQELEGDRLRIHVDTTYLSGPNMTVSGSFQVSCPE